MSILERLRRDFLWHFSTGLLRVIFLFTARVRIVFYHPLPPRGGVIVASNHISHFDPPLIGAFLPRRIDWMAMEELFGHPLMQRYLTGLNVISVNRSGGDRTALRVAARRLEEGRCVGIFPEGGIRDGAASIVNGAPMKQGLALLSSLSGAPIVPCVILGSDRLYHKKNWLAWRRAPVWIGFGPPIEPLPPGRGEEKREKIVTAFAAGLKEVRDRLVADFKLGGHDLPRSPQERMRED